MPRTLPAALTTAMDSGIYEPYIRIVYNADPADDGSEQEVTPLSYRLEPLSATVKIYLADPTEDVSFFRIKRGAIISGTPSTISTIWFRTVQSTYDGKFITLIGESLEREYITIAAGADYEDVITEALDGGLLVITPSFEGTATWKGYQFYPAGKDVILSPRKKLFTLLQQKYLVYATEDGWDGTNNNMFFFQATTSRSTDYSVTDLLGTFTSRSESRRLITRDESAVVRSNGSATSVIHNLGFLHSTASLPTNATAGQIGAHTSKIPVHLKYRTGDMVNVIGRNAQLTRRVRVIEVFEPTATPAWHQILEVLAWYGETEGGPLPSTIEAAAPYTPLATGNFDGVLSEDDNNLQAAMEKIDDHTHSGLVTGGNSHDHNGGDGAQIAYSSLSGLPTLPTSGTYTPIITGVTNVDTASAGADWGYIRVGNIVITGGDLSVDPTAGSGTTRVEISLPVASNFSNALDAWGNGTAQVTNTAGNIAADTADKRLAFQFQSPTTGAMAWRIIAMYIIRA